MRARCSTIGISRTIWCRTRSNARLSRTAMFEAGTDLRAWLFTIMHNVFVNQVRKASARAVHVSVDDESLREREFAVPGDQIRSLEMRDLDYALQRLPAEQREVVLLVGLEEMSYADVAHRAGYSHRHRDVAPVARTRTPARVDGGHAARCEIEGGAMSDQHRLRSAKKICTLTSTARLSAGRREQVERAHRTESRSGRARERLLLAQQHVP